MDLTRNNCRWLGGMKSVSLTRALAVLVTCSGVILLHDNASAIVRTRPLTEIGAHIFSANLGVSGSFEEGASGGKEAWSVGYFYHAGNPFGIGATVGMNKPEDFFCSYGQGTEGQCETQMSYYTITVDLRNPTRGNFMPFAQAGFGLYQLESNNPLSRYKNDDFGMFFGLGLEYLVDPQVGVGVSGNLHYASLDTSNPSNEGLGDWLNTYDFKAGVSVYLK